MKKVIIAVVVFLTGCSLAFWMGVHQKVLAGDLARRSSANGSTATSYRDLPQKQKDQLDKVVQSLEAVRSAAKTGGKFSDYEKTVLESRVTLKHYTEEYGDNDAALGDLKESLQSYDDVSKVWYLSLTDETATFSDHRITEVVGRYDLKSLKIEGEDYISMGSDTLFTHIWKQADTSLGDAERSLN